MVVQDLDNVSVNEDPEGGEDETEQQLNRVEETEEEKETDPVKEPYTKQEEELADAFLKKFIIKEDQSISPHINALLALKSMPTKIEDFQL